MRTDSPLSTNHHRDRTASRRGLRSLAAGVLISFLSSFSASGQGAFEPSSVIGASIDRLDALAETFPDFASRLEAAAGALERGLFDSAGQALIVDSCHLRTPPEGSRSFIEARTAVEEIDLVLGAGDDGDSDGDSDSDDDSDRGGPTAVPPPSLVILLTEIQEDLLDVYQFFADVAIREAQALASGGDDDDSDSDSDDSVEEAQEDFRAALRRRSQGRRGDAMSSLRRAWREAQSSIQAPPDPIGDTPILAIQSPRDGALLTSSPVLVAGMVQDITAGTLNDDDVQVAVNGVEAAVSNRSFQAAGIGLREGLNAITAVATDADGNRVISCIAVDLDTRPRARISEDTGNLQSAGILSELSDPLVVRVTDSTGGPVAGATVVFRVVQGNGNLSGGERGEVATTAADGRASAFFTLGSRAGVGVDRVRATAVGFAGEVIFSALAAADPAERINPVSGDNQRGAVGQPLAHPLVLVVTDRGDNPVAGQEVTVEVLEGGGSVEGGSGATVVTDSDGRAAVTFTLGPEEGFDNNLVEATFPGLAGEPVTFKASGFVLGDPADTRISGVVLDNESVPVPGVTLSVRGAPLSTTADGQGQFTLAGVPVGAVVLEADASTTTRPGVWASLDFELDTLPGIDNTLEKPIYILPLDIDNGRIVGGPEPVTVDLAEVPGFSLTVLPGSATFPDGSATGLLTVTAVHGDKIPMAPGSGMQPRIIVTVQPVGVHFDPPAPVTFPNVDGLAPGTVTEMFSFDHDVGEFVSIGTGTVSEDGLRVASDPGFGIVKAGWHCAAPQSGGGASASLSVSLSPDPIKIDYGEKGKMATASGSPPRDGEYLDWKIENKTFDGDVEWNGQPSCMDQPTCDNTIDSDELTLPSGTPLKACGTADAKVTFRCKTNNRRVTDTVKLEVGCQGGSAADCVSFCGSQQAQGMCGTPCGLVGVSPPPYKATTGTCWKVNVGGTDYCYWDHKTPGGSGFINLCCPNRCSGGSFIVWGQGTGNYLCTVIEVCSSNPEFAGAECTSV